MSQPTPYTRQFSFTNAFAASPTQVFPGASLDLELNAAKTTLDQVLQNIKLLQNDDGSIKNGAIGSAQLSSSLQTGFLAPTVWSFGVAYSASPASTVFTANKFYSCIVSHTSSSVFANDLAAEKWSLIADLSNIPLQTATNIAVTPVGAIVVTDAQSALAALDVRVTANTASLSGFTSANVTDSTATGRALMTAASADAAQVLLGGWSTGDAKFTIKTVADTGWLMMADQTIGSATSGATYANALAQPLYLALWGGVSDTYAPVTTGRGVSAAADWAANKPIALLKVLGRALAISGTGSGLTARTLGQTLGTETHAQTLAEMAAHSHVATTTLSSNTGLSQGAGNTQAAGPSGSTVNVQTAATGFVTVGATTTTDPQGSSAAATIMQPTSFWNVMIKL